jgi:hypothetical protein
MRFLRCAEYLPNYESSVASNSAKILWLLVTGYWLLVTGYWLLVTGYCGVSGLALSRDGRQSEGVKRLLHCRLYVRHSWREYKPYPVPVLIHQMVAAVVDGVGD